MPAQGKASHDYRQIRVAGSVVGLLGLERVFAGLRAAGRAPGPDLGPALLAGVRAHNYIPPSAEDDYAQALTSEYARYWERGESPKSDSRDRWRGIPRERILWYPALHDDLCDGCGKCIRFCPNQVFELSEEGDRVRVVRPLACQVGCDACVEVCPRQAIVFPPRSILEYLD